MKKLLVVVGMMLAAGMTAQADRIAPPRTSPSKGTTTAEKRAAALKANIERFELQLWPSLANVDKPYYSLTLTCTPVPAGNDRSNPFVQRVQITKDEATKIIDYLATEGFLENAVEYDSRAKTERPFQEGYHLHVSGYAEHQVLAEHWGWNRDLVRRLDALRKALDGNAGKAMDFLIGRLAGHRREWEQPAGASR